MAQNLTANLELLRHIGLDASGIGALDDRAHFGAKDPKRFCARQQSIQIAHVFQHLHAVSFGLKALVAFQERDNATVFPKIGRRRLAFECAVHGHLKQDCTDHFFAGEGGGFDDPGPHGVDQIEHLGF